MMNQPVFDTAQNTDMKIYTPRTGLADSQKTADIPETDEVLSIWVPSHKRPADHEVNL